MKLLANPPSVPPEIRPPNPCDPLFKSIIGHPNIQKLPAELRERCARRHFDLEKLKPFQFARNAPCGPKIFRDPSKLMRRQATYRVAEFLYPILIDPHPGLKKLTATVLRFQEKEKLPLILDGRPHHRYGGLFHKRRQEIHLKDTLSETGKRTHGSLDANTVYHEIGHLLMSLAYQGRFPKYAGPHHHPRHQGFAAQTTPGAAWSEGFAGGMGMLDYGSERQINPGDFETEEGKAWRRLPLKARLSNEFVIGSILGTYIKSEVPQQREGRKEIHIRFDAASARRFEKIVATLRAAGYHRNFQDFTLDLLARHPEEGARLVPILESYGLKDITSPQSLRDPRRPNIPRGWRS